MRWRGAWAAAQITGVIVSTLVWVVLLGGWPLTGLAASLLGLTYILGFRTRPGLWWRFGIRRPTVQQRDAVLAAIVPIASLRGRRQPRVWVGSRLYGRDVIMATERDLIVSPSMAARIVTGRLSTGDVCELVSRACGQEPVLNSRMVAAGDAYCLPWNLAAIFIAPIGEGACRMPLVSFSWRIRWIVFVVAIIDSWQHQRWIAVVGLSVMSILTWSTIYLRRSWEYTFGRLGDAQLVADGLASRAVNPGGARDPAPIRVGRSDDSCQQRPRGSTP